MGLGRFLVLWNEAQRRQARRQLMALEVAIYPGLDAKGQRQVFAKWRDAVETPADRERRWAAGWAGLDAALSGPRVGASAADLRR